MVFISFPWDSWGLFVSKFLSFLSSFSQDTHSEKYHSGNKVVKVVSQLSGSMNQV